MIFYFSATGNSLYAAQKLAAAEQTECISIAGILRNENASGQYRFSVKDGEAVGFVFPIYFCGLPAIVTQFLSKLWINHIQGHYTFLVLTYGAMDGNAAALFQKKLARQGLSLSAAYSVCTIDSYLPMFSIPGESEMEDTLAKANTQLEQVCAAVKKREKNQTYSSHGFGAALCTAIMHSAYQNGRKTAKFTVGDSCTGCGLCEKVCPIGAIELVDGKPLWMKNTCVLCLGCLHRCPQGVIDYGKKTIGKKRYMNSYVTVPGNFL